MDIHTVALCDHHHVRDSGAKFLAAGISAGAVQLDRACGRCARRIPACPQSGIRACRARLGVGNVTIMFRHMLPNAMVATLTMLPFMITGTIRRWRCSTSLGFGLPSSAPSLGELTLQAKQNLQAPWLAFTAFFTFAIMLSLLVFIFEGIRDAFDPRKTFPDESAFGCERPERVASGRTAS